MSNFTVSPGTKIGPFPYVIKERIGAEQGAMSEIYTAAVVQPSAPRSANNLIVVKIAKSIAKNGDFYEESLFNEVKHLRSLSHPGIVHIYPILRDGLRSLPYRARTSLPREPWFSVMEYLPGGSLQDLFVTNKEGLPLDLALETARYLACTFDYIHSRNVIHMDIKPQNIMFRRAFKRGNVIEPVLVDFGISRSAGQTGLEAGTLEYSSPERVELTHATPRAPERTSALPDASMDIYSLGIILYEMVTGQKPYTTRSRESIISDILEGQPTAPSDHYKQPEGKKAIATELDDLILRMLSKNPLDRPAADELANSLEQTAFRLGFAHRNFQLTPPTSRLEAPKKASRVRFWLSVLPFILAALVVGGLLGYLLNVAGSPSADGPIGASLTTITATPVVVALVTTETPTPADINATTSEPVEIEVKASESAATSLTDSGNGAVATPEEPTVQATATPSKDETTPTTQATLEPEDSLTMLDVAATEGAAVTSELPPISESTITIAPPATAAPDASTPVPSKTPTPRPPTPTPFRPTPTFTPPPRQPAVQGPANPVPQPVALSLALTSPQPGEKLPGESDITFSWGATTAFAAGDQLEIIICKQSTNNNSRTGECTNSNQLGANGKSLGSFPSRNSTTMKPFIIMDGPGWDRNIFKTGETYYWGVRLIRSGQPQRLISEARPIILD